MRIIDGAGDRGLQAERTRLAWRRTTLAATVAALLAVSRVVSVGADLLAVIGLTLVVGAWLAIIAVAFRRIRALTPGSTSDGPPEPKLPAAVRPIPPGRGVHLADRATAVIALLTAGLALVGTLLLG
jgi:Domain of unknown function (DUF202)